ncbi:MAG TPA: hypothetical protein VFG30_00140 [Polyangiales bacterium]|nr:hypothetical protein [Polyangiales bacterium]
MVNATTWRTRSLFLAVACCTGFACGDDDVGDAGTAGAAAVSGSSGSSGGAGGAGAGGRTGTAGRGTAGTTVMAMCSEPAPTAPVVCGGQTCAAPTGYMMNMCVYACCATVNGAQVCGAKSTNPMYATACEPPTTRDPSCPAVMSQGTALEGCCNVAQGKCGIISTVRPGCVTMSTLVMLPNPPLTCDGSSDGGGADAGL